MGKVMMLSYSTDRQCPTFPTLRYKKKLELLGKQVSECVKLWYAMV